jgi:hypothetical protein
MVSPGIRDAHLYHHINTAWNARNSTSGIGQATDAEFREWSAFPTDRRPVVPTSVNAGFGVDNAGAPAAKVASVS